VIDRLTRPRFPRGKSIYSVPLLTLITCGMARIETNNVAESLSLSEFYPPPKYSRYVNAIFHLLTISYTLVASKALEPLNCQNQNDVYIMVSNPSITCYSAEWKKYIGHIAAAVSFYMVGIPLLCLIIFFKHRKNVREISFLFNYGCLTSGYRDAYPWWELVNFFRKGVLTLVIYVLTNSDYLRIFVLIAVFLIIMFLQVTLNPFAFSLNNSLSFGWMLAALVCLFSGLVFSNSTISSVDSTVFTALILVFLICNIVFTLYAVVKEAFFSLAIKAEEKKCGMSYFLIEDKQHSAVKTYLRQSGESMWLFLSGLTSVQRRSFFDDLGKISKVELGIPQQSEMALTTTSGKTTRMRVESRALKPAGLDDLPTATDDTRPARPSMGAKDDAKDNALVVNGFEKLDSPSDVTKDTASPSAPSEL
jgi:hypothetical protein